MRDEQEMMNLIVGFARDHDDVRVVVMNGSRVNPVAKRDQFQDYDIVYLVREVDRYKANPKIIRSFGDPMIVQTPDDMGEAPMKSSSYTYLMQFMDGNRIDLRFASIDDVEDVVSDSLSVILLDKDGRIRALPPPSERSHLPKKPTKRQFEDSCNEYWWLNPYVAKGLHRRQLTYAKSMLDGLMREQLLAMLIWQFGIATKFQKAAGLFGKNIEPQIEGDLWSMLKATYSDADPDHIWDCLNVMNDLFRRVARSVATEFGFAYPEREDGNVSAYIRGIRALPRGETR